MASRTKKHNRNKDTPLLEALEARVLYSADPFGIGTVSESLDDILPIAGADASNELPGTPTSEVIFVDKTIPAYQQLIDEIKRDKKDRSFVIHTIGADQSIADVSGILASHDDLGSIHFITHGTDSNIKIGKTIISTESFEGLQDELENWGASVSDDGDILFYGCNLAATEEGKSLINSIADVTGADIAASTNLTGHDSFSADWDLEYEAGQVLEGSALFSDAPADWESMLAMILVDTTEDVVNAPDLSSVAALIADPGADGISLREAIVAANTDAALDVIVLQDDKYDLSLDTGPLNSGDLYVGDLDIYNSIHIQGVEGGNTTIDAKNLDRVFSFTGGTNTIENVKIQNGETAEFGGGILVRDSTVNLNNVTLHNNESTVERGGGIYTDGSAVTVNIKDSTISDNTAGKQLTDLNAGGAIHNWSATVTITRTDVINNKGSYGGAIFNHGVLDVKDSYLFSNSAEEKGGAILNQGLLSVSRTLFEENTAAGGAGLTNEGTALVREATFSDNDASASGGAILNTTGTSTIERSTIAYNDGDTYGAIDLQGGTLSLQGSIADKNNSNSGDDIHTGVSSAGHNLLDTTLGSPVVSDITGTDPKISNTLSDEGGFSKVHRLEDDSPAINAGAVVSNDNNLSTIDATGAARNNLADIGAYEYRQSSNRGEIFWVAPISQEIYHSSTDGSNTRLVIPSLETTPSDVEVDPVNNRIYWLESFGGLTEFGAFGKLFSANLDGTDITTLVTGLHHPTGLALDVENERLFVTHDSTAFNGATGDNSIDVYTLDGIKINPPIAQGTATGGSPQNRMITPTDVEYDVVNDVVFWTDRDSGNAGIQSVDNTGTVSRVLSDGPNPAGLALVADGSSLYWADGDDAIIHSNSSTGQQLDASNTIGTGIYAIDYHAPTDTVYASDTSSSRRIITLSGSDLTDTEVLYTFGVRPGGLSVTSFDAVTDGPSIEINTGVTVSDEDTVQITESQLNSIDPDDTADSILYEITNFPQHGKLFVDEIEVTIDDPSFTQADINKGNLKYEHLGSQISTDSFDFLVTDNTYPSAEKKFDISVVIDNDAPSVTALETTALQYTENDGQIAITGTATIADSDDTHLETAVITIDNGYQRGEDVLRFPTGGIISSSWDEPNGQLTLFGTDTIANYEDAIRLVSYQNTSENPNLTPRNVSIVLNDGELNSVAENRTIEVSASNDAPVLSLVESTDLSYQEGDGKRNISNSINVSDVENDTIHLATIKISNGYQSTQDRLDYFGPGSITASWNDGNGTLTLTGEDSIANYNAALRSVTYENTSDGPTGSTREVTFTVNDGSLNSATETRVIAISTVNDNPQLSSTNTLSYTEGELPKSIAPTAVIIDPDATDLDGGQLKVTLTGGSTVSDRLTVAMIGNGPGEVNYINGDIFYEGVIHATGTATPDGFTPLEINLNSNATSESVQAILRNILYENVSNTPLSNVLYLIELTDGDGGYINKNESITIATTNDAALITNLDGSSIQAVNNGTTYLVDENSASSIIDPDRALEFSGGSLTINGLGFTANDTLGISTANAVTLSSGLNNNSQLAIFGVNIGTLTNATSSNLLLQFNNNATADRLDQLVHALEFSSTAPDTGVRTIEIVLNDGDGTANGGDDTSVASVNIFLSDASVGTVSIDEDTAHTFSLNDFSFTGANSDQLESITVTGLPGNGTLYSGIAAVSVNDSITRQEIIDGALRIEPEPDSNGSAYTSFEFYINNGNNTVNILSGNHSFHTLDNHFMESNNHHQAAAILTNPLNFGPNGTVLTDVAIQNSTDTIDASYLSEGEVLFSGFLPDGSVDAAELAAIDDWVQNGGILIASGDLASHDDINSYYGLVTEFTFYSTWYISDIDNPVINGYFGLTGNLGDTFSGFGYSGHFDQSSLATGDTVIARHLHTNQPTMVLRAHGAGQILFTADEGIFRRNMDGDGDIVSRNDTLTANVYAWAVNNAVPSQFYTMSIDVDPVNDSPEISLIEPTLSYRENDGAIVVAPSLTIDDIDNAILSGATVAISTGYSEPEDMLSFNSIGAITGIWTRESGTLTLLGDDSLANYQSVLRSVTYENSHDNPATDTRTVSFTVNDGENNSSQTSREITVTRINDAPQLDNSADVNFVAVDEDTIDPPATIVSGLLEAQVINPVTDPDNEAWQGIAIVSAPESNGQWQYQDSGTWIDITDVSDSNSLLLDKTTSLRFLPDANYHGASAFIEFRVYDQSNTSPAGTFVSTAVNGGATPYSSNIETASITVNPVNDAPSITALESTTLEYTENSGAIFLTSTVLTDDIDNINLHSATLHITEGYIQDEDQLSYTGSDLGTEWDAVAGKLRLTGIDTLANYQAAIRQVVYENYSDHPDTNNRTVEITVDDGALASIVQQRKISVTAINNAPALSLLETGSLLFQENAAGAPLTNSLTISDPDNTNISEARIQFTQGYIDGEDVLEYTNINSINGSWDKTTGTLLLTGTNSLSSFEDAIRSVTYRNLSDNPDTAPREITFTVNNDLASAPESRVIHIDAINDAPLITAIETSPLTYTENSSAVPLSSTIQTNDLDTTHLTGATITIVGSSTGNEDSLIYNGPSSIAASYEPTTSTLTLSGNESIAVYQNALRAISYQNSSDSPDTANRTIEFVVSDGSDLSSAAIRTMLIIAENDAPAVSAPAAIALDAIDEDTVNPAGASVQNLFSSSFSDADNDGQFAGIAVVSNPATIDTGAWQFSANGSKWHNIDARDDTNALILNKTALLRFLPEPDFFGSPDPLSVRLIDNSYTQNFSTDSDWREPDVTVNGGTSAISANTATLSTHIRTINDQPATRNASLSQLEDLPTDSSHTVSDLFQGGYSDIDGTGIIAGIAITGNTVTVDGEWQYSSDLLNWYDVGEVSASGSLLIDADSALRFMSAENFNGAAADLLIRAIDDSYSGNFTMGENRVSLDTGSTTEGVAYSATQNRLRATIEPVNDAPLAADNTIYVTEDTPYNFSQADFGFSDSVDGDNLSEVKYSNVSAGQLSGTASTGIIYTPEINDDGPTEHSFSFTLVDDGGTDRGGNDTSSGTNTIRISMIPVNDAPTGTSTTITISEDQRYIIRPSDFGFTDIEAHRFEQVIIDSIPVAGQLQLNNTPVVAGDVIEVTKLQSGSLQFIPASDEHGSSYADLGFRVVDNGTTANDGNDTDPNTKTLTFDVNPVNDPPVGRDGRVTATEDEIYRFSVSDFGFSDPGDNNNLLSILIDGVPSAGTLMLNNTPLANSSIVTISDIDAGLLRFTAPENSSGPDFTDFSYRAMDDGGTLNGGNNISEIASTIIVDITAVNDQPSGTSDVLTVLEDTPYTLTSAAFGFSDPDQNQTLAGVLVTAVPAQGQLTLAGVPVQDNHTISVEEIDLANLVFQPEPNSFGNDYATIDFRVIDNSGATDSSQIDATSAILSINVLPLNDPADEITLSSRSVEENSAAAIIGSLEVADVDPDDTHTLTVDDARFEIVNDELKLREGVSLDYESEPEVALKISAVDAENARFEQNIILVVQNANDPPLVNNPLSSISDAAPYTFQLPIDTFFDIDGDALTLSAAQPDGSALPDWLSFDQNTHAFTAAPTDPTLSFQETLAASTTSVVVRAVDPDGATAELEIEITREPVFASAIPAVAPEAPLREPDPVAEEVASEEVQETNEDNAPAAEPQDLLPDIEIKAEATEQTASEPVIVEAAASSPINVNLVTDSYLTTRTKVEVTGTLISPDLQTKESRRTSDAIAAAETFSNLAQQMNENQEAIRSDSATQTRLIGTTVTLSSGLSVGYILWLVRGGTLVASMLTSLPAWRFIDPLPVLGSLGEGSDGDDTETLESMVQEEDDIPPDDSQENDRNNDLDKAA